MAKNLKEILALLGVGGGAALASDDSEAVLLPKHTPGGKSFDWDLADTMRKQGKTEDEIWQATRTQQSAQGKPEYEVSDLGMKLVPDDQMPGKLNVIHDELEKAFPDLFPMSFMQNKSMNSRGSYSPLADKLKIKLHQPSQRGTAAHEIQHKVQEYLDLPSGTASNSQAGMIHEIIFTKRQNDYDEALKKFAGPDVAYTYKSDPARLKAVQKFHVAHPEMEDLAHSIEVMSKDLEDPASIYYHSMGESQANSVKARADFSQKTLDKNPPRDFEPVPRPSQVSITNDEARYALQKMHPKAYVASRGNYTGLPPKNAPTNNLNDIAQSNTPKGQPIPGSMNSLTSQAAESSMPGRLDFLKSGAIPEHLRYKEPFPTAQKIGSLVDKIAIPGLGPLFPSTSRVFKDVGESQTKKDKMLNAASMAWEYNPLRLSYLPISMGIDAILESNRDDRR